LRRRRVAEMIGEPRRNRRMKKVREVHGHEERKRRPARRLSAAGLAADDRM
jgi:hypothetical protein